MKKIFTTFAILLSAGSLTLAQTLVTTQPMNKNVILEDFTGIHCQYCPDGHEIAQSILDNNPGRSAVVSIHQGIYAVPNTGEPDYRTPFGDALANQTGLTGYPSGTVNRHVFSGSNTALNRGDWVTSSNIILDQPSPVNVGIESDFDSITRLLTVHVELYYTSASSASTNYINVALIQDHIFGPQTGGGAGNDYEHMHMLRYFITGQWGDAVTPTTQGTLVERTYNYTVPDAYNSVPCVVSNCQVAVYVAEGHQEILSGDVVDAIGGTNLYIGDITTTDSVMQEGTEGSYTQFNLMANSNLEGTEPFIIRLTSDAPSDWLATFTVEGQTGDSVTVDLVKGTPSPIELQVLPGATAGFYSFTFELTSVNNPEAPTKYFTVFVISGVNTLLVYADGDATAENCLDVYMNGLLAAGSDKNAVMSSTLFEKASVSDILGQVICIFYDVAWTFPAFTDPQALALKSYIDQGGHVFVAGQDIGWDIMSGAAGSHGTPEAQDLYTNYFKAHWIADGSSADNKLIAETTDEIFGDVATSNIVDVYSGNMYPDQISPLQNASATFYYNTTKTKIGAIRSMKDEAKVAYFGVGLEMVQTVAVADDIIKKAWDWFMEGVGISDRTLQESATLGQNIPNPAGGETTIRFKLPFASFITLQLYDMSGKPVRNLMEGQIPAGSHQVTLSTIGLNPGVYYYTLQTDSGKITRKMVVVR